MAKRGRPSNKPEKELDADRRRREMIAKQRDEFRRYALDGRRYRSLSLAELQEIQRIVEDAIARRKDATIAELKAQIDKLEGN